MPSAYNSARPSDDNLVLPWGPDEAESCSGRGCGARGPLVARAPGIHQFYFVNFDFVTWKRGMMGWTE